MMAVREDCSDAEVPDQAKYGHQLFANRFEFGPLTSLSLFGGSVTSSVVRIHVLGIIRTRTKCVKEDSPPMHRNSLLRRDIPKDTDAILRRAMYSRHEPPWLVCPGKT